MSIELKLKAVKDHINNKLECINSELDRIGQYPADDYTSYRNFMKGQIEAFEDILEILKDKEL